MSIVLSKVHMAPCIAGLSPTKDFQKTAPFYLVPLLFPCSFPHKVYFTSHFMPLFWFPASL